MDNAETSLREIMAALLALGPASGPDQTAMRKAIGGLLQSPPDGERLGKAWRQVRRALEELQAPSDAPSVAATPELYDQSLKSAWDRFSRGEHFDLDAKALPDGPDGVVTALATLDRKGETKGRETLSARAGRLKAAGAIVETDDAWLAVEQAALITGGEKWPARANALRALAPEKGKLEAPGWTGRMAEARRRLHLGEALGRSFGVAFDDIDAELNQASDMFAGLGDIYGVGASELVRGRAHAWRGQLMEASEALSAALVAFVELGNDFRLSDVAYELGAAYRELHRFESARRLQAKNVGLEAERGQVGSLARAMQSYAMTHINEARLSPNLAPEEKAARTALLAKAKLLSGRAFLMTTMRAADRPPEDIRATDDPPVADIPNAILPGEGDKFRATLCARDLAEIALLSGDEGLARRWLERAMLECEALVAPGRTMMDTFVMPAMVATRMAKPEDARQEWEREANFEQVRLAELELRLPSLDQRTPMQRAEDLDLVARAWDIQKLPAYAIEAWLNAADLVEAAAEPTSGRGDGALAARHWRYLALSRAAGVGSAIHARGVVESPVELSDVEKAAAAAAKVSVLQFIESCAEARLFRVRAFDAIGTSRLLVRSPGLGGWDDQIEPKLGGTMRERLEAVSRQRPGVPRIQRSGTVPGAVWVVDEDVAGRTLDATMQDQIPVSRVLKMLAELGDTLQALLSTGMGEVWPDAGEIVCAPGDKLVLRRYGKLYLGSLPPTTIKDASDVTAYVELAKRWLGVLKPNPPKSVADLLQDVIRYEKTKPSDQRLALASIAGKFKGLADSLRAV